MEKYSHDQALAEADEMNKMLKNGTAKSYEDANSKINILDEQRKIWDRKWSTKKETIPPSNFAFEVLSELKGEKLNILDLGAGDGKDSVLFAQNGHNVTAVDLSSAGIAQLNEAAEKLKLKIHSIVSDLATLELDEDSYDVIYSNLGVHFFDSETTKNIFNKLYSALKKDGKLFISAKATADEHYGKGQMLSENMYEYKGQIRHFFSEKFTKELLSAFHEVEVEVINEQQKLLEGGTYNAAFVRAEATK